MNKKIKWEPVVMPNIIKWENLNTKVAGRVLWYSEVGASTYNDEPCGFIDLAPLDGGATIRVVLDKPQLSDAVRNAHPTIGDIIGIKFAEEVDTGKGQPYKKFDVLKGREIE